MDDDEDFEKLPGLYRSWELALILLAGRNYRLVDVGLLSDGGALFAVYVALKQVMG